ncbi:hypothetical protein NL676_009433 [Syzygium grande]|nr:hypothetical protein NL676_009433 [Syzygium grande]
MAKKEQASPLAPTSHTVHSDEDEALLAHFRARPPSYFKCRGIAAALFLIIADVTLAIVFTVFHVRDPIVQMNRVQIPQLTQLVSNGMALAGTNITSVADVSDENPNVASFRYGGSVTEISYGGEVIGEGRIPAGRAAARRTRRANVTVEVVPGRIAAALRLSGDLTTGNLEMERGFEPERERERGDCSFRVVRLLGKWIDQISSLENLCTGSYHFGI